MVPLPIGGDGIRPSRSTSFLLSLLLPERTTPASRGTFPASANAQPPPEIASCRAVPILYIPSLAVWLLPAPNELASSTTAHSPSWPDYRRLFVEPPSQWS